MQGYFVYCLYNREDLVYIGSSSNLRKRVRVHSKDKVFDKVIYCELPTKEAMLGFEEYGIYNLNPPLNKKVIYKPDRPDIEVSWLRLDLSFLIPACESGDYIAMSYDYHNYQAEVIGISYKLRHDLFHMEGDWTFERELTENGVIILARSDNSGKSVENICTDLGGLSYEQYKYDWLKYHNLRDIFTQDTLTYLAQQNTTC